MMTAKLFLLSLLLHLVADYTLQGCLACMKQQMWWWNQFMGPKSLVPRNISFNKYRNDYICGLACHALYWTLVTFAPLLWLAQGAWMLAWIVVGNTVFHAVVDHAKCNRYAINLWQDQMLHLAQIVATFAIFYYC